MSKSIFKVLSLVIVVVTLFGAVLTGCSGAAKQAEPTPGAAADETKKAELTPEKKKEPIKIRYSTFRYEDEAIFKSLIEKFQKENPSITVEYETNKDTTAYYQNLKASVQSGDAPDVIDIHPGNEYSTYVKEGVLADLSDQPWIANYADGPKALTTIDGKIYGFNQAINMITCIYNKEIFSKHGVVEPKDWNEFVGLVTKLKDAGEGGIAYCGGTIKAEWLSNALFLPELGADAYKKLLEGMDSGEITSIKDNTQVVSVLKTLGEFNRNKLLYNNSDTVQYPQSLSLFAQKKTPIVIMGTWTFGTKETDYPGIDVGIFAIPTMTKSNIAYAEGAQISCVNAQSKNIEAAKQWINFLATAENSALYNANAKMTSTVKGVKADFPESDKLTAQMDKGVIVMPIVYLPKQEFWKNAWNNMLENILFKGADVDKEIAAYDEVLKKADIKNKK